MLIVSEYGKINKNFIHFKHLPIGTLLADLHKIWHTAIHRANVFIWDIIVFDQLIYVQGQMSHPMCITDLHGGRKAVGVVHCCTPRDKVGLQKYY